MPQAAPRSGLTRDVKCDMACKNLVEFARDIPGLEIISAYLPIKTELCALNAMHEFFRRGKRVCLPVVVGSGQPLRFREWRPGAEMQYGAFGTSAPARGAWLEPRLLIVPLLAFDRQCNRLGYGGGFYDRTIARLESAGEVLKVGLAFAEQECARVPCTDSDRRLDAVITQTGIIRSRRPPEGGASRTE